MEKKDIKKKKKENIIEIAGNPEGTYINSY